MATAEKAIRPIDKIQSVVNSETIKAQFQSSLRENAGAFISSLIELYSTDYYLQQCDPQAVAMEALKAASLKLPINKQLGFAYLVPYNIKGRMVPQFQIGYKGLIQLALRTGQYRRLNAGIIYDGVQVEQDILTGDIRFYGQPSSKKPQGYFAYMELLNGFAKTVYMAKAEVEEHAKKYSRSYNSENSAWKTHFDEMAMKTVLRRLLSHYGALSTELVTALAKYDDEIDEAAFEEEVAHNANREVIEVEFREKPDEEPAKEQPKRGPDF